MSMSLPKTDIMKSSIFGPFYIILHLMMKRKLLSLLSIALLFLASWGASANENDPLSINFKPFVADYDSWNLEWIDEFDPTPPGYEGKPFNWDETQLITERLMPKKWQHFSAGCNGVSPGAPMTLRFCLEAIPRDPSERDLLSDHTHDSPYYKSKPARSMELESIFARISTKVKDVKRVDDKLIWYGDDQKEIAKFKLSNTLADGKLWAVDEAYHQKVDKTRTPYSYVRFTNDHVVFNSICNTAKRNILLSENKITLRTKDAPPICHELDYQNGDFVELKFQEDAWQPSQIIFNALEKSVEFKRFSGRKATPYDKLIFYDKAGQPVLHLRTLSNKDDDHRPPVDYKAVWQLILTDEHQDNIQAPYINFQNQNLLFPNRCDRWLNGNGHALIQNRMMAHLSVERQFKAKACDPSDENYSPYQSKLETIFDYTSVYVVKDDKLYLGDKDMQFLGAFKRVSNPPDYITSLP